MTLTQIQSLALGGMCALLFAVVGGSIVEWSKWIARYRNGVKSVRMPTEPQATVGLVDILVTFLVLFALFFFAAVVWRASGLPVGPSLKGAKLESVTPFDSLAPENQQIDDEIRSAELASNSNESNPESSNTSQPVTVKPAGMTQNQFIYSGVAVSAQLLCVILMSVFIRGRTSCTFKKLGWRTDQVAGDVVAGLQCFLMMTPVILVLNGVLQGLTKIPYEHPVQEMIKQYPWLLGIAFWQAAIVAPISEEFGFRVLLIGWFESIHFGRNKLMAFLFGSTSDGSMEGQGCEENSFLGVAASQDTSNPYNAPLSSGTVLIAESSSGASALEYCPPWWPALLSGALFGLAHFSYGVSWVALIVFGVVLGRLYQMRQSILPVILVHFLFNAMNVTMLGLSILLPNNLGN